MYWKSVLHQHPAVTVPPANMWLIRLAVICRVGGLLTVAVTLTVPLSQFPFHSDTRNVVVTEIEEV